VGVLLIAYATSTLPRTTHAHAERFSLRPGGSAIVDARPALGRRDHLYEG